MCSGVEARTRRALNAGGGGGAQPPRIRGNAARIDSANGARKAAAAAAVPLLALGSLLCVQESCLRRAALQLHIYLPAYYNNGEERAVLRACVSTVESRREKERLVCISVHVCACIYMRSGRVHSDSLHMGEKRGSLTDVLL